MRLEERLERFIARIPSGQVDGDMIREDLKIILSAHGDRTSPVMRRPDWDELVRKTLGSYVMCGCGDVLQTTKAVREHWQAGHFDGEDWALTSIHPDRAGYKAAGLSERRCRRAQVQARSAGPGCCNRRCIT